MMLLPRSRRNTWLLAIAVWLVACAGLWRVLPPARWLPFYRGTASSWQNHRDPQATAFVAVDDPAAAVALLSHLRTRCGERITGFELLARMCLDLVLRHIPGSRDPLPAKHPWYLLVELSDSTEGGALDALLEEALGSAAEDRDPALSPAVREAVLVAVTIDPDPDTDGHRTGPPEGGFACRIPRTCSGYRIRARSSRPGTTSWSGSAFTTRTMT